MKRLDNTIMTFIILAVISLFVIPAAFWPCVCSAVMLNVLKKAIPEILDDRERRRKL